MMELGRIPIRHQTAVGEARRKLRVVTEELTRDPILATRVATAVSEMTRTLLRRGDQPHLRVSLESNGDQTTLVLSFADRQPLPSMDFIQTLVDSVDPSSSDGQKGYVARAFCALPVPLSVDAAKFDHLRTIVEEKSRNRLMSDLQIKNRELQESFESLKRTTSAKERMESELNIGQEIQMSMLPVDFPAFPNRHEFDVFATLHPARQVGGDFYDFFLIDEDQLCFGIGDVSGKGVPSALFMAMTKTLIKSRASNDSSPASILTHVNDEMSRQNEASMFVTIWLGILDVGSGTIVYTNAGHNPPYLLRRGGEVVRLDKRHGPVVGAVEGMVYKEDKLALGLDDFLLLYTDGVTEAMDAGQQLYEETRLANLLAENRCDSTEELIRLAIDDVWLFQGEAEQADDVTLLALQFYGNPEGTVCRSL